MREKRWCEQKGEKRWKEKRRWGGSWCCLVDYWSTAPPHLPLPHPLCNSFNSPLLSVIFNSPSHSPPPSLRSSLSHTARHKRQRGGSNGWINQRLISLFLPRHREIQRSSDREGSKKEVSIFCTKYIFLYIYLMHVHRCQIRWWLAVTDRCTKICVSTNAVKPENGTKVWFWCFGSVHVMCCNKSQQVSHRQLLRDITFGWTWEKNEHTQREISQNHP